MSHDVYDVTDDHGLDGGCPQVEKLVVAVEALRGLLIEVGLTDKGYSMPLEIITEQWASHHAAVCEHCKAYGHE